MQSTTTTCRCDSALSVPRGWPDRMALENAFTSMLGGVRSAAIASGPRGAVLTLRNERGDCARFEPVRAQ
ncbi:MAG: hypothetical protein RIR10_378 [Planctomycetota bacterium]